MRPWTLPLLSCLVIFRLGFHSLAISHPLLSPLVPHEKRNHVPAGWSYSRKHHATAVLPLRFALSQPNIHAIDQYIYDIAHPDSRNYGNHWTAAQVAEKFAPRNDTIQTVNTWLLESGFSTNRIRVTKAKSWIELNATVEEAEKLLNAQYYIYKHASGKEHVGE
jgi:tripeptidyl-peptidase-1